MNAYLVKLFSTPIAHAWYAETIWLNGGSLNFIQNSLLEFVFSFYQSQGSFWLKMIRGMIVPVLRSGLHIVCIRYIKYMFWWVYITLIWFQISRKRADKISDFSFSIDWHLVVGPTWRDFVFSAITNEIEQIHQHCRSYFLFFIFWLTHRFLIRDLSVWPTCDFFGANQSVEIELSPI